MSHDAPKSQADLQAHLTLPDLRAVVAVVEGASQLVLELLRDPIRDWAKGDASPVTSIDIAVDRFLYKQLRPLLPGAGWLSEETADNMERLNYRYLWVVDPIDGTRALIAGQPEFCVSVGLVETGVGPLLGIIANPSTGELYYGVKGRGAFDREGARLRVKRDWHPETAKVLVSRSDLARGLWHGLHDERQLHPSGSLAYKMALVAQGRFDGHATPAPRSEWDAAAGMLLLSEAGGVATDAHGRPLRFNQRKPLYDGVVVASQSAYPQMLLWVQESARIWLSRQT
jgi:myo-inositol-1(or 4)-monophosphatase